MSFKWITIYSFQVNLYSLYLNNTNLSMSYSLRVSPGGFSGQNSSESRGWRLAGIVGERVKARSKLGLRVRQEVNVYFRSAEYFSTEFWSWHCLSSLCLTTLPQMRQGGLWCPYAWSQLGQYPQHGRIRSMIITEEMVTYFKIFFWFWSIKIAAICLII